MSTDIQFMAALRDTRSQWELFQIIKRPHVGHVIKWSYGFKDRSLSLQVRALPSFGVRGSSAGGDMMYLVCYMYSHDQLIDSFCKFMGESSLQYVTMLISLLTITSVIMEIECFQFVAWPLVNTCLKCCVNIWVELPFRESQPCHVWWKLV